MSSGSGVDERRVRSLVRGLRLRSPTEEVMQVLLATLGDDAASASATASGSGSGSGSNSAGGPTTSSSPSLSPSPGGPQNLHHGHYHGHQHHPQLFSPVSDATSQATAANVTMTPMSPAASSDDMDTASVASTSLLSTPGGPQPNHQLLRSARRQDDLSRRLEEALRDNRALRGHLDHAQRTAEAATQRCDGLKRDVDAAQREKDEVLRWAEAKGAAADECTRRVEVQLEAATAHCEQLEQRFRHGTANLKEKLREQLVLTDEQHAAARAMREEDMELLLFVRCLVYEKLREARQEVEEKTRYADALAEQLDHTTQRCKRLERDLELQRAAHRDEVEALRQAVERHERQNELNTQQIVALAAKADTLRAKEIAYDQVQEKVELLERQLTLLHTEAEALRQRNERLQRDVEESRADAQRDRHQSVTASGENRFLARENEMLKGRNGQLEQERLMLQEKVNELKKEKHDAIEKGLRDREEMQLQHEQRLQQELDRLRLEGEREMEHLRLHTREVNTREVATLREARDQAIADLQRTRTKYKEVKDQKERLLAEHRVTTSEAERSLSELRESTRAREVETQRLRVALEEYKHQLISASEKEEIATAQLGVLKAEFFELKAQHAARVAELQTQVDGLRQRLEIYNALERETDDVVQGFAARDAAESEPNSAAGGPTTADVAAAQDAARALAFVPSAPTRRIQQAIALARQATQLQAQVLRLQEELGQAARSDQESRAELAKLKAVVGNTAQPYGYFITALHEKDQQVQQLSGALAELQQKHTALWNEHALLQEDMERLLEQQRDFERLKQIVLQWRNGDASTFAFPAPAAGPVNVGRAHLPSAQNPSQPQTHKRTEAPAEEAAAAAQRTNPVRHPQAITISGAARQTNQGVRFGAVELHQPAIDSFNSQQPVANFGGLPGRHLQQHPPPRYARGSDTDDDAPLVFHGAPSPASSAGRVVTAERGW